MPLVLFDHSSYLSLTLRTGTAQTGLCSSMGPVGVDNERAEEHSDYNPSSDDGNGICSVPAERHPMSSFSIIVSTQRRDGNRIRMTGHVCRL